MGLMVSRWGSWHWACSLRKRAVLLPSINMFSW